MGQSRWVLVAIEGRYSGSRYPITERGVSFGREADNDLVLDDENVSRHHAILKVQRDRPVLEDLKSRNGTFVNNKKIARLELTEGDRIALGTHLFKVVPAMANEPEAVSAEVDPERTIIAQHALGERREAPPTLAAVSLSGAGPGRGRVALHAAPPSGQFEDATLQKGRPNLAVPEEPVASGPIFGGAAAPYGANAADPGLGAGSQGAAGVEIPAAVAEPPYGAGYAGAGGDYGTKTGGYGAEAAPAARRGRGRQTLIAALGALVVVVVGGGVLALTRSERAAAPVAAAPSADPGEGVVTAESPAAVAPPPGEAALFPAGGGAPAAPKSELLTPEEQAMAPQERLARAKEHFDQGESFMESEKLKEAREEFQRAFALDAGCKICLIRLSKVDGEIKKTLEKYKGDALRSQKALEYDKARRFWEMVLELESDPEGQRVARQGIAEARAQLQKQSYR